MSLCEEELIEAFFRIHFVACEEILEDALPLIPKIKRDSELPSKVKEALGDSGPAIFILNRMLDTQFQYQPDAKVENRTLEVDDLYKDFCEIYKNLPNPLEFLSLVSAIIAFHKKETNYVNFFSFVITLISKPNIIKKILQFLDSRALHISCPYIADDPEDGDFLLDDLSDVDTDMQGRVRTHETPSELIHKAEAHGDKGLMALYLNLTGDIYREDLVMMYPEFTNSRIGYDPVAIDQNNYVTQSIKRGVTTIDYAAEKYYPVSYRGTPDIIKFQTVTAATIFEEFVENRDFLCLCNDPGGEKAPDPDKQISLPFLWGAAEILHNQDNTITLQYKTAVDIATGTVTPAITEALRNIYDFQCDEIYESLVKVPETGKVIGQRMRESLDKMCTNYYRSYNGVFVRLSAEAVKGFPHAEYIQECLDFLNSKVPTENPPITAEGNISFLREFLPSNIDDAFRTGESKSELTDSEAILVNQFSKLYKQFIRKYHPDNFMEGLLPLQDCMTDWSIVYEHSILSALKELGMDKFDSPEVQLQTPILNDLLTKTSEDVLKVERIEGQTKRPAIFTLKSGNRVDIKVIRQQ